MKLFEKQKRVFVSSKRNYTKLAFHETKSRVAGEGGGGVDKHLESYYFSPTAVRAHVVWWHAMCVPATNAPKV